MDWFTREDDCEVVLSAWLSSMVCFNCSLRCANWLSCLERVLPIVDISFLYISAFLIALSSLICANRISSLLITSSEDSRRERSNDCRRAASCWDLILRDSPISTFISDLYRSLSWAIASICSLPSPTTCLIISVFEASAYWPSSSNRWSAAFLSSSILYCRSCAASSNVSRCRAMNVIFSWASVSFASMYSRCCVKFSRIRISCWRSWERCSSLSSRKSRCCLMALTSLRASTSWSCLSDSRSATWRFLGLISSLSSPSSGGTGTSSPSPSSSSLVTAPSSVLRLVSLGLGFLTAGRLVGVELPDGDLTLAGPPGARLLPPSRPSSIVPGLDCEVLIRSAAIAVLPNDAVLVSDGSAISRSFACQAAKGSAVRYLGKAAARSKLRLRQTTADNLRTDGKVPCVTSVQVTSTNEQWRALSLFCLLAWASWAKSIVQVHTAQMPCAYMCCDRNPFHTIHHCTNYDMMLTGRYHNFRTQPPHLQQRVCMYHPSII